MKIHNLKKFPKGVEYSGEYSLSEFNEWDIEKIPREVEEIWYWYARGDFCGSGQLLMRVGAKYSLHYCGHCSCYGPTGDEGDIQLENLTLDQLRAKCSSEYLKEVEPLFRRAELAANRKAREVGDE